MITPTLTPVGLLAAAILVLTVAALLGYHLRRRRVAHVIGDASLLTQLLGVDLTVAPWRRLLLAGAAATAIAGATLALPSAPPPAGTGPVVLILDASGSMLAEDVSPNRLEVQRALSLGLLEGLGERPVGAVAFAGRAFSLTPPTTDHAAVRMYLETVDPTIVTHGGSAFGSAIRQGVALLGSPGRAQPHGTLVIFGDGDDTEDQTGLRDAVELARRAGVRVHAVGIGTPMGAPVPALDLATGRADGYLREADGRLVITSLDEALLGSIAARTGGAYVDGVAAGASETLAGVVAESPDVTTASLEDRSGVPVHVWLAALALTLLLLEPVAGAERRREG